MTEFVQFLVCYYVLGVFPCSSSAHRAPGKKAAVPIYKVLERPGRESNSRPTSLPPLWRVLTLGSLYKPDLYIIYSIKKILAVTFRELCSYLKKKQQKQI